LQLIHKYDFFLRIVGYRIIFAFGVIVLYGLVFFLVYEDSVYNFRLKFRCFRYFLSKFSKSNLIFVQIPVFLRQFKIIFVVDFGYFARVNFYLNPG